MRLPVRVLVLLTLVPMLFLACSQPAPAPTAAPAKAAEPTKASAPATTAPATSAPAAQPATAQPTAAPAAKVDYPQKGKTVNLICPWPAGGGTDVAARLYAQAMERELGIPFAVANKGGAGSQVGLTEAQHQKPDGYNLVYTYTPANITIYLDPERKSTFGRKDFLSVSAHAFDPYLVAVKAGGPYKDLTDLVSAAKANPEKVKVGNFGGSDPGYLAMLQLEKMANVKFASVTFDGGAPAMTALLGGHVDATITGTSPAIAHLKSGAVKGAAALATEENKFAPGTKTAEAQGYKIYWNMTRVVFAPAGTPKEIITVLDNALKKIMADPDHVKKLEDTAHLAFYKSAADLDKYWDQLEEQVKPLMELLKTKQ